MRMNPFFFARLNALVLMMTASSVEAFVYSVNTIAGLTGITGSADGTGTNALFFVPHGVAVDSTGSVYVADQYNNTIRKLTLTGGIWTSSTIAGQPGMSGGTDGTGSTAQFNKPAGLTVDASGNIYVADEGNDTIRKVTPFHGSWIVTTIAGQTGNAGTADGANSAAQFYAPTGVAVDGNGNLFVSDWGNHTIRELSPSGTNWIVSTIAGNAGISGTADGTNSVARFYHPEGVAVDSNSGDVYVADWANNAIRQIKFLGGTNWNVSTIAGLAGASNSGSADGVGSVARFYYPSAITVDGNGNLYVADTFNNAIRFLTPSMSGWQVMTIAGQPNVVGSMDGIGTGALFYNPAGIAAGASNNVFVADIGNQTIRVVERIISSTATVQIPADADIYGAGNADISSLGGGGGVAPVEIDLPTAATVLTITNVTGIITLNSGGGSNNADGVIISGSYSISNSTSISSYGGLSGITMPGGGALVGVFEPSAPPAGTGAPPALDFTIPGANMDSFAPALYQVFYIGDGLTGNGSGVVQQFIVPTGATRLFLGIADAYAWSGAPGYYGDNIGNFIASFQFSSATAVSTNILELGDEDLCNTGTYSSDPKAGATLVGLAPGVVTYANAGAGQSAPHSYPFSPTNDYPGTDQIYVGSHETASDDGYSSASEKINGPQIVSLNYSSLVPAGQSIATMTVGIAADDFQFPYFSSQNPFAVMVNGITNADLTAAINNLSETGPYVQFLTIGIDPAILQTNNILTLSIDEGGNGGDGWAIDFLTIGVTMTNLYPANLGTNLIVNSDAEAGPGSDNGGVVTNVPGWDTSGDFTVLQYGSSGGYPLPTDPGPSDRGTNFFAGGPGDAISTASQIIDVSANATLIDAGQIICTLNGYLGGFSSQDDNAVLTGYFLNGSGATNGFVSIGPVLAAGRTNITSLLFRQATAAIPVGTHSILVVLQMTRTEGAANDGYADDLSLSLTQGTISTAPVITADARNLIVTNGSPAYFPIGVSGASPLYYQWQKNGTNLIDGGNISGSTTNALSLGTVTTSDAGNYSVTITNSDGSVTSSVVSLTVVTVSNQFNLSLPLSTGSGNKSDLGFFPSGQIIQLSFVGHGDLVDSRYQTLPDGSLLAPAGSPYDAANPGSTNYTTFAGGDGVNHYAGGGQIYDSGGGSGWSFAGKMTTDTTDPEGIRAGAVVGTFSSPPLNTNWFYVGYGGTFTVPAGGAHLYLAVNDTYNGDDHGTYYGIISTNSPLQIQSPQMFAGNFNLSFQSVNSQSYTLYYNDNLATTNWIFYTNVIGNGTLIQLAVPVTNSTRFFRIAQP